MADTIHAWPLGLEDPLVDGYTEGGEDGVLRTQFDVGPAKTRPKYTGRPAGLVQATVPVSRAGMQTLDDFYWDTLNRVGLFYWTDHRRPPGDDNVAVYRFAARPSYTPRSDNNWRATLQLERVTQVQGEFLLNFSDDTTGLTT